MITAILARPLPPPTEGASSRLNAIVDVLRAMDPGFRVVVAEAHPRERRARAGRLAVGLLKLPALAVRALAGPNRILLVSSPALPFFETPSRIDLLLASGFLLLLRLGCLMKGAVLVLNLHDFRSLQLPDFGVEAAPGELAVFDRAERRALRASHYILSPGDEWPDWIAERYGVARDRVIVFPNGCIRVPEDGRDPAVDLPGRIRFVYAGALGTRGRGLEAMVRAFRGVRNPEASLILLGPDGGWCEEASGGDPRVRYLGALPVEECIRVLRRCHVALYPYPDLFYFAMTHTTNKMALYLTCGLPLLANRSRAVERFVTANDLGVICEMDEMTRKMEEMAAAPERLARWRDHALAAGKAYYWDVILDRAFAEIARHAGLPPLARAGLPLPGRGESRGA